MPTGLDYSSGTIAGSTVKASGYSFCIRYVDDPAIGLSAKHISSAEYHDLLGAGVQVLLVFEQGTDDSLSGATAGSLNATRAAAGAQALGYPAGLPVFMAVDMHVAPAQVPVALAYLSAARTILDTAGYTLGVYGFTELITAAQQAKVGAVWWQCGHDPGPTSGVHLWQRNTGTVQVGGIECDVNSQYLPLPAAAAVSTPVGDNVIVFDWPAGAGAHKLVCPVGSASAVTGQAWLSLACDGVLGRYDVWFQSDRGGVSDFHGGLVKDQRVWWSVPDGCTQITLHYSAATGAVGAAIETRPK